MEQLRLYGAQLLTRLFTSNKLLKTDIMVTAALLVGII